MTVHEQIIKARAMYKARYKKRGGVMDPLAEIADIEKRLCLFSAASFDSDGAGTLKIMSTLSNEAYVIFTIPRGTVDINAGMQQLYNLYICAYAGKNIEAVKAEQKAPKPSAPKAPQQGETLTLEKAGAYCCRSGKNAGVPFSKLDSSTLQWLVNNLTGTGAEAAKKVLASRETLEQSKQCIDNVKPVDDGELPY